MNHPIHFVSLGPGDPELITLKGLKTLQKADIIYCPATQGKHGIISRATDILKAIEVDESLIHPFILPMSKERTDALNAYNELFLDAQAEYLKGKLPFSIFAESSSNDAVPGITLICSSCFTICIPAKAHRG